MEARTRRQVALLAALIIVMIVALTWGFGDGGGDSHATLATADRARAAAGAARGSRPPAGTPTIVAPIALEALRAAPPDPIGSGRNPFRFQQHSAPTEEGGGGGGPVREPAEPMAQAPPPPPPGPPPIPLRFIGIVDETRRHLKLAVLSDGRNVFYGREGDIIEGRYRIVRIGLESIEMTHVDGRGQQTIRLSGS
ncbi:MAG TPA: hypothetical protein VHH91_00765 [Vicinamibacterales bacterium]|jgi:hypothetical protein|nr:hypothetical protein [Vicinamibacterales bacterium]